MVKEIWKDIKNYEKLYQVSNLGRVKSLKKQIIRSNNYKQTFQEKILTPSLSKNGYLTVALCDKGKQKTFTIHRLVAETFIKNKNNHKCVNHKDENKLNNNVNNLEWCTYKYNNQYNDKMSHRRIKVNQYSKDNRFIKQWDGLINIEKELNINRNNITTVCKGKRKTAGGYIWRYVDEEFNN